MSSMKFNKRLLATSIAVAMGGAVAPAMAEEDKTKKTSH